MSDEKLYHERVELYDLIYTKIDYAANAERLADLLAAEGIKDGARVLETACGTGSYLAPLASRYDMIGLDASEEMLTVSRRKNPGVPHLLADMADFTAADLASAKPEPAGGGVDRPGAHAPLDAVVCLFSSFGYLHGAERVRAALRCFARVLRPAGVVVVEPWITRKDYRTGYAHMDTYSDDTIKVARLSHSTVRPAAGGEAAVIDFEWAISRAGSGLDRFSERHELWFCPPETMDAAFREAGMTPRFEPEGLLPGRGLWIARRDGSDDGDAGAGRTR